MNLNEQINKIKQMMCLTENEISIDQAVIEILIPMAYLSPKDRFQIVPYWKTKEPKIYIVKGSAGGKTISTKNIKVLNVFKQDQTEEMNSFLNKIREEYWEAVKHYYK